jgi:3-phosphoshikimate 1-carboxyvinyltransferase
MSHRAVMFGALALGETAILGFQEGEDLLGTAAALRAMCAPGARTVQEGSVWRVRGFGVGTAREPLGMKLMNSLGTYEAT